MAHNLRTYVVRLEVGGVNRGSSLGVGGTWLPNGSSCDRQGLIYWYLSVRYNRTINTYACISFLYCLFPLIIILMASAKGHALATNPTIIHRLLLLLSSIIRELLSKHALSHTCTIAMLEVLPQELLFVSDGISVWCEVLVIFGGHNDVGAWIQKVEIFGMGRSVALDVRKAQKVQLISAIYEQSFLTKRLVKVSPSTNHRLIIISWLLLSFQVIRPKMDMSRRTGSHSKVWLSV